MFQFFVVVSTLAAVAAFNPLGSATVSRMQMSSEKPSMAKLVGAAVVASSVISMPVFAKEGEGAKLGIFTNNDMSSPFAAGENREDPIYSPYSPYGNGEKAVYNGRKGSADELKFWNGKFAESAKRVDKVPSYASKKLWYEITNELTRFTYDMRQSMLRLAESAKDPKAATAAAKVYFDDLNDMFVFAKKKDGSIVTAAYEKSKADLAAFKALL